jgi:hypothetical protein
MFRVDSEECRFCHAKIEEIKNLGELFSCGIFPSDPDQKVDSGILAIGICQSCSLVQLLEDYDHTKLYTESYGYRSSLNESMVAHLDTIAEEISKFLLDSNETGQVQHLDIGSNDATLLKQVKVRSNQKAQKVSQLGIDPSGEGFREFYTDIELIIEPFQKQIALDLDRKFQVISSIAMFYDLPNPIDFVRGIKSALDSNGVWISEQSYFGRMIEQNAFDTICQEHLEYYSIQDIVNLCEASDLELFDVKFNDVNGGSFRFYAQHKGGSRKKSTALNSALADEVAMDKRKSLTEMFQRTELLKSQVLQFLQDCKKAGLEVHGYGASTKGNTLLQYFGITSELLPFIAERNEDKFGKFTPGTKIPIISEQESKAKKPYAYFVLPWHFKSAILVREGSFRESTETKFCFPLPTFEII